MSVRIQIVYPETAFFRTGGDYDKKELRSNHLKKKK